ncbi:HEPN domain-containing protein [Pseudomonas asiatica]|uniref:HEPN domain-containing protein n=1 Tax=Pseudomonas TaxID=286 RepID=UPI00209B2182|nr:MULTISPECIES: HEPN domain-containing protein [Pseudomonas]MCO7527362.1 HEPN domain-containing protein [Pseudomonas asiatica]MDH4429692.1 HEPN domain-containing protein [Pseudomonas shirazica]
MFEFDEPLLKALTRTKYAADHLDYDFFMGLLHSIIVNHGVHDPLEAAKQINHCIETTSARRDWVAIVPFMFNNPFDALSFRKPKDQNLKIGAFTVKTIPYDFDALSSALKSEFNLDGLLKVDHQHQTYQGSGSIEKCPLILLEVHGAQEAAFDYAKRKVKYLTNLFEVYGVLTDCKNDSWAVNEITTNHIFLASKATGEIARAPLFSPTRININPDSDFYESIDEEFSTYANMVIHHNDRLFARLKSALNFFSRAINGADKILGFISYVIAIEAIFSRDKHTPIRITLAEYIALLCYPPEERVYIYKTVKKIYDARSALVHTGTIDIDHDLIEKTEEIAAKTILHTFKLYHRLYSSDEGKIEDRFFDHLRDLRLGVSLGG